MNFSELQKIISKNLKNTTPFEIFAGKYEEVIFPKLIEITGEKIFENSKSILKNMEKVSADFQFLQHPSSQKIYEQYTEANKKIVVSKEKLNAIKKFSPTLNGLHFKDYREDFTGHYYYGQRDFKEKKPEMNLLFGKDFMKLLSSSEMQHFCNEHETLLVKEILRNEEIAKKKRQDLLEKIEELKDKNPETVQALKKEEDAFKHLYEIFENEKISSIFLDDEKFCVSYMSRRENRNYLLEHLKTNIIPEDWRKELYNILNQKIPNFSGKNTCEDDRYNKKYRIKKEKSNMSYLDLSFLLATKHALENGNEIINQKNEIFLTVSGGVMAKITFKEKGEFLQTFQKNEIEFYYLQENREYKPNENYQEMYGQFGYENSSISIELPEKWYILTNKFEIETDFYSAPVLFGSLAASAIFQDFASFKKKNDFQEDDD